MTSIPAPVSVWVASQNPSKQKSVQCAFERFFGAVHITGHDVRSGVPKQPFDNETFDGAQNRVQALEQLALSRGQAVDFLVAIEGGIWKTPKGAFAFSVTCIAKPNGPKSFGISAGYGVPEHLMAQLSATNDLGAVMDAHTGQHQLAQRGGVISVFTRGELTRAQVNEHGVITALIPFLNTTTGKR